MKKIEKIQHPITSFGINLVSHAQIRFERLALRVEPNIPFPHKHSFYQLLLVSEGRGTHTIDFKTHEVSRRSLFLMKPGQMHAWKLSKNIQGLLLEFNRESLRLFQDEHLLNEFDTCTDALMVSEKSFIHLQKLFEYGLEIHKKNNSYEDLSLGALLTMILVSILELPNINTENLKPNNVVNQFRALLETYYKTHHEVDFYAGQLQMNPKNLSMHLSRHLGKSPRALIHQRLILEAKRYLAYSDLSIGAIAEVLGFEDQNYFTRFYKKSEGYPPRQFKKIQGHIT